MIRTNLLKGAIASSGLTQYKVAIALNISPKTFYDRMKKGVFGSDEIEKMIKLLDIKNPIEIFFAE